MMRKYLVYLVLYLAIPTDAPAEDIRVGLFYKELVNAFTFHCTEGEYEIRVDGDHSFSAGPGDIFYISLIRDSIYVNSGLSNSGPFAQVDFVDRLLKGRCRIKAAAPSLHAADYSGDIYVSISHGTLQVINKLDFDRYLAGVVEAEAGPSAPGEFYKAQAVLCRTYALRNWDRHEGEGFNMCDHTHCQAFHGISNQPSIYTAVLATHNIIVADRYSRLILPAFHSNSGGETGEASDAWPVNQDYLKPIIDPFSKNQKHSEWTKSITTEAWTAYLQSRGVNIAKAKPEQLLITQPHRKRSFVYGKDTLSMTMIRDDLGLKSAFFDMTTEGDSLVIHGRGYGHGIGLSQEGAMEMAREGYSYSDILRYYFNDITVTGIDELPDSELPEVFR